MSVSMSFSPAIMSQADIILIVIINTAGERLIRNIYTLSWHSITAVAALLSIYWPQKAFITERWRCSKWQEVVGKKTVWAVDKYRRNQPTIISHFSERSNRVPTKMKCTCVLMTQHYKHIITSVDTLQTLSPLDTTCTLSPLDINHAFFYFFLLGRPFYLQWRAPSKVITNWCHLFFYLYLLFTSWHRSNAFLSCSVPPANLLLYWLLTNMIILGRPPACSLSHIYKIHLDWKGYLFHNQKLAFRSLCCPAPLRLRPYN